MEQNHHLPHAPGPGRVPDDAPYIKVLKSLAPFACTDHLATENQGGVGSQQEVV